MIAPSLSDLVVLDASDSIAGQFATRILADHGADVTLVEPIEGTPARAAGPMSSVTGRSLLFNHLNGGKDSIVVPVPDRDGASWWAWCDRADVVVIGDSVVARGLRDGTTRPVVCGVTDFADGPYARWRGSEIVHQALSGSMFVTGTADREPLFGVGDRASYAAGLHAYNAIVALLCGRADGAGARAGAMSRLVEISVHEAAAAMEQNFSTQWSYNRTSPSRDEKARPRGRAQCRDGWVVYFMRAGEWETYCRVFGAEHLLNDPRFASWHQVANRFAEVEAVLADAVSAMSVAELVARADADKLVLAPMKRGDQLHDEPHLVERRFWQHLDDGDVALGPLVRFGSLPVHRDRPAPQLGTKWEPDEPPPPRTPAGSGRRPGAAANERSSPASAAERDVRPLSGVNVLELTGAWAGPMAARMLANLGADVIKVEGPRRYDAWRGERTNPALLVNYPDLVAGEHPYDRHLFFNSQNHDKRSLVVDLRSDAATETFQRLLPTIDVLIANWSPGALHRVGLGYEDIGHVHPRLIMIEMPAMGLTGPLAQQRGLGPTMEAMAGIANLIGYADGRALGSGTAYLDPTGALHGVAAAVTALLERQRTGVGQHVEVAQREAAMHWIGEHLLDNIVNDAPAEPTGNVRSGSAPHGAYPAIGHDAWIALDVRSDGEFAILCDVLGSPALSGDPRFVTMDNRMTNRDELDAEIGHLTAGHDKHRLADVLQGQGVAAAPVNDGRDLFADPQLRSNGWFAPLDHPAGRFEYPGLPTRLDGERLQPRQASPVLGQHTRDILGELGFSVDQIDEWAAEGSIVAPC